MLKDILKEKTKGSNNEIQLTQELLADLQHEVPSENWGTYVKNSTVFLAIKSPFGFWKWKEGGKVKEHCDPDDYIIIKPNLNGLASIDFKKKETFEAMELVPLMVPSLVMPCQFYEENV
jgi:hypothetical protein